MRGTYCNDYVELAGLAADEAATRGRRWQSPGYPGRSQRGPKKTFASRLKMTYGCSELLSEGQPTTSNGGVAT